MHHESPHGIGDDDDYLSSVVSVSTQLVPVAVEQDDPSLFWTSRYSVIVYKHQKRRRLYTIST